MNTPQIGLVRSDTEIAKIKSAVSKTNADLIIGEPSEFSADIDCLAVSGEEAFRSAATQEQISSILPVDFQRGIASIPVEQLPTAIQRIKKGDYSTHNHPILSITVDHIETIAFWDVGLITNAPARISEYVIESPADDLSTRFRADGVVVSTPAGSHGYSAAAGGSRMAPETGIAITPIAPFTINIDHWVVSPQRVTVTVCRDEAPVAVEVDGQEQAVITGGQSVQSVVEHTFQTIKLDISETPSKG